MDAHTIFSGLENSAATRHVSIVLLLLLILGAQIFSILLAESRDRRRTRADLDLRAELKYHPELFGIEPPEPEPETEIEAPHLGEYELPPASEIAPTSPVPEQETIPEQESIKALDPAKGYIAVTIPGQPPQPLVECLSRLDACQKATELRASNLPVGTKVHVL